MINESTVLIDRWLKHPDYGVAKMIDTVGRETPEGTHHRRPEDPAIYNDIEDEEVASDLEPAHVPALVIYVTSGPEVELDAGNRLRQIGRGLSLAIAYVTREMPTLQAVQDGGYVLRAVKKSLTVYNSHEKSKKFRALNDIKIMQVKSVGVRPVRGAVGKSQLWGFVFATLIVVDSDL